jgi:CDP-diacylglycerol--glycerol-3-phosphate 3-phosphatidyltransferase
VSTVKDAYTDGARRLATRSMTGLAQTRLTPNTLTALGVSISSLGGVLVYFENRNEILFYWLGGVVFVIGSLLDVLDGALARQSGKGTPFGAFIDSTTDRIGEFVMLGAIALVFFRHEKEWALALAIAAIGGSFLVSYTRARAEALGLKGNVGLSSRAERVVIISGGLAFAPWGGLPWAILALAASTWLTVLQRIFAVKRQLAASP